MIGRGSALLFFATLTRPALGAGDAPPSVDQVLPELSHFRESERTEVAPWVERPFALEAQASLGGPLGLVGGAVDVSPSAGFSLNGGVGIGASSHAPQVALMARLRLIPVRGFGVGAEGGIAFGKYTEHIDCPSGRCPPEWHWQTAFWGIAGLFLERRTEGGLTFRWSFGAGSVFNVPDAECVRCETTDEPGILTTTVPYALVSAGYAFDL